MTKHIIEGRRTISVDELYSTVAHLLGQDEKDGIYLQGHQYLIIEVIENK